jgi:hypothetical protein
MNQVKRSVSVQEMPATNSSNFTFEAENKMRDLVAVGGS